MFFDIFGKIYTTCELLADGRLVGKSATAEELRAKNGLASPRGLDRGQTAGHNVPGREVLENDIPKSEKSEEMEKPRKSSLFSFGKTFQFLDYSGTRGK